MPILPECAESVKADLVLPVTRVRIIMKSSADPSVPMIKCETLHLVSRATEMLIKTLAKESLGNNKTLEYKHIAEYVQSDINLEFLHSILPKKITGKAFLKLLNENDVTDESEESESSSSSSSDDDESSSSDSDSSEKADDAKKEAEDDTKKEADDAKKEVDDAKKEADDAKKEATIDLTDETEKEK